ncbi:MAG: TIGR00645 family protein [Burkholderiaceae bacterium]
MLPPKTPYALLPRLIFASRWLQLPLYLGLIVAQVVYVFLFIEELLHLVELLWNPASLDATVDRLNIAERSKETVVMIIVLSLIDVVMISNLLIMVIVGGYETFVSRLRLEDHPDQPEWLSHVNANVLKVKLATAIIGISSIHLLKSFISAGTLPTQTLLWQTIIHAIFLLSAIAIALIDRLMSASPVHKDKHRSGHGQPASGGPSHH